MIGSCILNENDAVTIGAGKVCPRFCFDVAQAIEPAKVYSRGTQTNSLRHLIGETRSEIPCEAGGRRFTILAAPDELPERESGFRAGELIGPCAFRLSC